MPAFETMDRKQKAVLWAWTGVDEYGEPTVDRDAPIEIDVRWTEGRTEDKDADGNTIAYDAQAVVDRDIRVGSIMWLGKLADFADTGDEALMRVAAQPKATDLKNRVTRRTVKLQRYQGTRPTDS